MVKGLEIESLSNGRKIRVNGTIQAVGGNQGGKLSPTGIALKINSLFQLLGFSSRHIDLHAVAHFYTVTTLKLFMDHGNAVQINNIGPAGPEKISSRKLFLVIV
jgi:hypothetical protein